MSSPFEERLTALWRDIFECATVSPEDDFFDLGGHSLHAMQLTARIREHLGVDVQPRLLFQHPTVARLASVLEEGTLGKGAKTAGESPERGVGPVRLPRDAPLPLTAPQRQLWYLDQLQRSGDRSCEGVKATGDASYNMMVMVRLRDGTVDVAAARAALDVIVQRHEVLRTRFVVIDGEPRQQIDAARRAPFTMVDLRGIHPARWSSVARTRTEALLRRPFDLSRDAMLRAAVLLGPDEHRVVLTMHHIASDGWSIGVLLREFSTLYRTFRANPKADSFSTPAALQYADVAHWHDQALDGPRRRRLLDYWRRQLDGAPQHLELPTDHPRVAGRSTDNPGASYPLSLSSTQRAGLEALGRAHGTTLFMTLLAAWSAFLYRFSWQRDLLHSVPFASRLHPASEGLLGFFTNMLVLRVRLEDEGGAMRTFEELLRATREMCLDAIAHQDLPFVQLVEALRPDRQGGRMPFVQVGFALQNAFRADQAFPELEIVPTDVHTGASRFELSLSMMQEDERLTGSFEYRTDLFEPATIARFAAGFSALVDAVVRAPTTPLDRLRVVPATERQWLLGEWGRHDRPFDLTRCVHHWVADQIALRPQAESARFEGQTLTYRQLGERASRLARSLRAHGVRTGTSVGLLLNRSLELPIAFLAVLQAGGVCVPLDPDHPPDRLAFMLTDTDAAVVVTQAHLARRLPEGGPDVVLDIDAILASPTADEETIPAVERDAMVGPGDLAYIVYTSGSTGLPKGVLMHHRGLCNRLLWQQDAYPLEPDDRVLQNLSIGFDAAIWQIFGPLIAGATIVLPRPGGHMHTAYLAQFLGDEGVTCADFVPSVLTPVLDAAAVPEGARWDSSLRQIVSGGEALHRALADRVASMLPSARLINIYGPTETSLTISAATCAPEGTASTVPIGVPIANTRAYLLDAHGELVPAGVVGEVHASGVSVTIGYLNRPGLTAERFPPDPFADQPGQRMYRTGDLARLRPDGALEFLGRADHQVKIRGVRIELGEIEARLGRVAGVADAAVLARTDVAGAAEGEKRLVAYVVAERSAASSSDLSGSDLTASRLRAALSEHLPPAMVPGIYLVLPEMPVTMNGKIDRKALPAPEATSDGSGRSLVPPRDRVEAELVEVWCRALGLQEVSVTDHFFDLGGHSLLAVRLMADVHACMGVQMDPAELYAAGTVEEMARRLRGRTRTGATGSLVTLSGTDDRSDRVERPELFCVHAVDGAVHGYAHLARQLGSDLAVHGVQAPGLEEGEAIPVALLDDFAALASHHVDALVAFRPRGPFVLCGWSTGGLLASVMARQLEALGRPPERVILLDTHPSTPESSASSTRRTFDVVATDLDARRSFFTRMVLGPPVDWDHAPDADQCIPSEDLEGSDDAYLQGLTRWGIDHGRLPAGTEVASVARRWQVFRRLARASVAHLPRPHHCPMTLIQADATPATWRVRQVAACRTLTRGSLTVLSVAADHHAMLRAPAVVEVADRLATAIRTDLEDAEHATRSSSAR